MLDDKNPEIEETTPSVENVETATEAAPEEQAIEKKSKEKPEDSWGPHDDFDWSVGSTLSKKKMHEDSSCYREEKLSSSKHGIH